jgi:hypothetical protein
MCPAMGFFPEGHKDFGRLLITECTLPPTPCSSIRPQLSDLSPRQIPLRVMHNCVLGCTTRTSGVSAGLGQVSDNISNKLLGGGAPGPIL